MVAPDDSLDTVQTRPRSESSSPAETAATVAGTAATRAAVARWRESFGETQPTVQALRRSYRPWLPPSRSAERGRPRAVDHEDSFTLAEELGRGGMGIVSRARQAQLARDVALKFLRDPSNRAARRAFDAEVAAMARLEHPGVVPVHAAGEEEGHPYLAMKLVDGQTWAEILREAPDDLTRHLGILEAVCNAVAFAHSRGILHCDLKPANVMLGSFGEVLIMDWGLAVSIEPDEHLRLARDVHAPCGTPLYMAPELANGDGAALGPWTDVYLLGGILCELLTGQPPHSAQGPLACVVHAVTGELPTLPASAPEGLRALCLRALEADPARRFPDAAAFGEALRSYLLHRESLALSADARGRLARCAAAGLERNALYEQFGAAIAGFEQARKLWDGNPEVEAGLRTARERFARAALEREDFGLAALQIEKLPAEEGLPLQAALRFQERQRAADRVRTRRLRIGLASALVCLVAGLGLGLWFVSRERARVEARHALAQDALRDIISGVRIRLVEHGGAESRALARTLLEEAIAGFEELRSFDEANRRTLFELAWAHFYIAQRALDDEGDLAFAETHLAAAEELLVQAAGTRKDDAWRYQSALVSLLQADLAERRGDLDATVGRLDRAVAWLRAISSPDEALMLRSRTRLANALGRQAGLFLLRGKEDSARVCFDNAAGLLRRWGSIRSTALLAQISNYMVLSGAGERGRQLAALSVEMCRAQLAADPSWIEELELAWALQQFATIVSTLDPIAAERAIEEAREFALRQYERQPGHVQCKELLAEVELVVARLRFTGHRYREARGPASRSSALYRELLERKPDDLRTRAGLVEALSLLARLGEPGETEESASAYAEGLRLSATLPPHLTIAQRVDLRAAYGEILALRGEHDEALRLHTEAIEQIAAHYRGVFGELRNDADLQLLLRNRARIAAEAGYDSLALASLNEAERLNASVEQSTLSKAGSSIFRAEIEAGLGRHAAALGPALTGFELARAGLREQPAAPYALGVFVRSALLLRELHEALGDDEAALASLDAGQALTVELALELQRRPLVDAVQLFALERHDFLSARGRDADTIPGLEVTIAIVRAELERQPDRKLHEELAMLLDRLVTSHLFCGNPEGAHQAALAYRDELAQLDGSEAAHERLADIFSHAARLAAGDGDEPLYRACLAAQEDAERALVEAAPSPARHYALAATLYNRSLTAAAATPPAATLAALAEAAALLAAVEPDGELARRVAIQAERVRSAALLDGWVWPASGEEFRLLARGLEARGAYLRALDAYERALEMLPAEVRGPTVFHAARCAAQAGDDERALAWLGETVADLRAAIADADGAERAELEGILTRMRADEVFAGLRERVEFQALFEAD